MIRNCRRQLNVSQSPTSQQLSSGGHIFITINESSLQEVLLTTGQRTYPSFDVAHNTNTVRYPSRLHMKVERVKIEIHQVFDNAIKIVCTIWIIKFMWCTLLISCNLNYTPTVPIWIWILLYPFPFYTLAIKKVFFVLICLLRLITSFVFWK